MTPWTPAELATLARLYPTARDRLAVYRALPGRRWATICRKATDLGLKRPGVYDPKRGNMRYSEGT